nr:basic salivary proline-rich protein 1-like [Odocoileus virginianus texanus]
MTGAEGPDISLLPARSQWTNYPRWSSGPSACPSLPPSSPSSVPCRLPLSPAAPVPTGRANPIGPFPRRGALPWQHRATSPKDMPPRLRMGTEQDKRENRSGLPSEKTSHRDVGGLGLHDGEVVTRPQRETPTPPLPGPPKSPSPTPFFLVPLPIRVSGLTNPLRSRPITGTCWGDQIAGLRASQGPLVSDSIHSQPSGHSGSSPRAPELLLRSSRRGHPRRSKPSLSPRPASESRDTQVLPNPALRMVPDPLTEPAEGLQAQQRSGPSGRPSAKPQQGSTNRSGHPDPLQPPPTEQSAAPSGEPSAARAPHDCTPSQSRSRRPGPPRSGPALTLGAPGLGPVGRVRTPEG